MKNMKTILSVLILAFFFNTANAANIDTIEVVNTKNVDLQLSTDITLGDTVEGEIKILKDINVTFASKDFNDATKVALTLNEDLQTQKNYSLLSIFGADGNIDFRTTDSLDNVEIMNDMLPTEQGIVKVIVKDSRTLEVIFLSELEEDEFEFKLLSELTVDAMKYNNVSNKLQLSISELFEKNFNYMIIVLSLKDNMGSEIVLNNDLYNFETSDTLAAVMEEEVSIESLLSDEDLLEPEMDTVAITEEENDMVELEEVALNAAASPSTGAETGIVLLFTTLITGFIFLRKKLQLK